MGLFFFYFDFGCRTFKESNATINMITPVMRGSRNFRQGGGGGRGQSDNLTKFFFFFFLLLSLFYRSQMVNFKEIYHFSRSQRGSNIFQVGPTFSRGGVQLLIPYRNPYNLSFSRGVRTPCPPSGSALACHNWKHLPQLDIGRLELLFYTLFVYVLPGIKLAYNNSLVSV